MAPRSLALVRADDVPPDVSRMSVWRTRLFDLLLRLDAKAALVDGVPADRVRIVDVPIER